MSETWKKCGHPRTPENTKRCPDKREPSGHAKQCRQCVRAANARYDPTLLGRESRQRSNARRAASGAHALILRNAYARRKAYEAVVFGDATSTDKRVRLAAPVNRVVVLSDIQAPFEDPAAVDQALGVLETVRPDLVILNGDVVDCYAESAFSKNPNTRGKVTKEGHVRARKLMAALQDIPKKVWLGGNHEDRWRRLLWDEFERNGKLSPVAENLLAAMETRGSDLDMKDPISSFARIFDMDKYGFEYHPYGHRLYLADDNLVITHGKYVSRHSGQSAKRTLEWLGRSCIVGHTHRLGNHLVSQDGITYGAWENGCLCQLEPEYDDTPNWQQGFSIVKVDGPEFHVIQVPIIRRAGKPVAVYHGEGN